MVPDIPLVADMLQGGIALSNAMVMVDIRPEGVMAGGLIFIGLCIAGFLVWVLTGLSKCLFR